eukprot:TRINITY_DN88_c0_g1_i3.p1 TRINITY_DN88_c0_g1~~TRINITY_DN88_c0_g1_i3.p1  ORF type:complete len:1093 (-),score=410.37 TRINITY_DN88_c0_g1_i3:140-3418(-)
MSDSEDSQNLLQKASDSSSDGEIEHPVPKSSNVSRRELRKRKIEEKKSIIVPQREKSPEPPSKRRRINTRSSNRKKKLGKQAIVEVNLTPNEFTLDSSDSEGSDSEEHNRNGESDDFSSSSEENSDVQLVEVSEEEEEDNDNQLIQTPVKRSEEQGTKQAPSTSKRRSSRIIETEQKPKKTFKSMLKNDFLDSSESESESEGNGNNEEYDDDLDEVEKNGFMRSLMTTFNSSAFLRDQSNARKLSRTRERVAKDELKDFIVSDDDEEVAEKKEQEKKDLKKKKKKRTTEENEEEEKFQTFEEKNSNKTTNTSTADIYDDNDSSAEDEHEDEDDYEDDGDYSRAVYHNVNHMHDHDNDDDLTDVHQLVNTLFGRGGGASYDDFDEYCQALLRFLVDSDFMPEVYGSRSRDSQRIQSTSRRFEDSLCTRRESLVASSAWKGSFRHWLMTLPYYTSVELSGTSEVDCEACGRSRHPATFKITLSGFEMCADNMYGPKWFEVVPQLESRPQFMRKTFYVGRHCHWRTRMYSRLLHFKYRILHEIDSRFRHFLHQRALSALLIPEVRGSGEDNYGEEWLAQSVKFMKSKKWNGLVQAMLGKYNAFTQQAESTFTSKQEEELEEDFDDEMHVADIERSLRHWGLAREVEALHRSLKKPKRRLGLDSTSNSESEGEDRNDDDNDNNDDNGDEDSDRDGHLVMFNGDDTPNTIMQEKANATIGTAPKGERGQKSELGDDSDLLILRSPGGTKRRTGRKRKGIGSVPTPQLLLVKSPGPHATIIAPSVAKRLEKQGVLKLSELVPPSSSSSKRRKSAFKRSSQQTTIRQIFRKTEEEKQKRQRREKQQKEEIMKQQLNSENDKEYVVEDLLESTNIKALSTRNRLEMATETSKQQQQQQQQRQGQGQHQQQQHHSKFATKFKERRGQIKSNGNNSNNNIKVAKTVENVLNPSPTKATTTKDIQHDSNNNKDEPTQIQKSNSYNYNDDNWDIDEILKDYDDYGKLIVKTAPEKISAFEMFSPKENKSQTGNNVKKGGTLIHDVIEDDNHSNSMKSNTNDDESNVLSVPPTQIVLDDDHDPISASDDDMYGLNSSDDDPIDLF